MKKKKMLHISSSLKVGGAEILLCDIIEKLGTEQFEHEVIYFHDGPRAKQLQQLGVKLHHLRGLVCLYDPVFFIRLFWAMKKIKPDCIHSLLWAANVTSRIFAKWLSIPHVSAYHIHINQDGAVRKILDKLTLRFADKMVAVSQEVAESFLPAVSEKKRRDVLVIENGIDAQAIRKKGAEQKVSRKQLGLLKKDFIIGAVGRFAPRKNFPLLLESFAFALKNCPDVRLVLLGTGPDEQLLRQKAKDLKIEETVSFVINQPAYGYFPLFDCFVQSSSKEGLSIALLEAMSFGLPSVVIETGDAHPAIKDGYNGLLVKKSEKQLLAKAILTLAQDRGFAKKLGSLACADVEGRFSVDGMVDAYKNLFLELSNRNSIGR